MEFEVEIFDANGKRKQNILIYIIPELSDDDFLIAITESNSLKMSDVIVLKISDVESIKFEVMIPPVKREQIFFFIAKSKE